LIFVINYLKKEGLKMYDLLIKDGLIIDGTDSSPYRANIAVNDDKIIEIGDLQGEEAREIIDARGKNVSPGFIDMHCHDEIELLKHSTIEPKIRQGVTTIVNGNCGMGFYPLLEKNRELLLDYNAKLFSLDGVDVNWHNYDEYKKQLNNKGININAISLMAHGALRIAVLGFEERKADAQEMERMKDLLREGVEQGVYGMSSGLLYPPSSYADKEEIKELCSVLAEHDLIYATHMRNESDNILHSIKENIEIARETGVSVEISHLNVSGKDNWGKSSKILKMLKEARESGLDISCDQYPYKAGSTFLTACLPQWTLNQGVNVLLEKLKMNKNGIKEKIRAEIKEGIEGWDNIIKSSGWDNIVINSVKSEKNQELLGKSLEEITKIWDLDYYDTLYKLLLDEEGYVTILIYSVCEDDLFNIFKNDFTMIGTDGIKLGGKPHPRLYGSYPKIISKFIREKGLISLEEGIKKMTSLPAKKLGLKDRGALKKGYFADIVIFDYQEIEDLASYLKPQRFPAGIEWVIVNGKVAYDGNKLSSLNCGKIL